MSIQIFRTPKKTYIVSKQLTPVRNQYYDTEYTSLDDMKGDLLSEIINGYVITQNMLGIDFIDSLLEPINIAIEDNGCEEMKSIGV